MGLTKITYLKTMVKYKYTFKIRGLKLNVVFYNIYNPSVSFYSGKIARRGSPLVGDVVYTKVEDLENLSNYEIIYEENGQVLVRMN